MIKNAPWGRAHVVSLLLMVGLLTGCGAASQQIGAGMMGNGSAAAGTLGGGMMNAGPGYQYSPLSCAATKSPPSATVNVTLGDMNMSQMMGGTAPMGSVMMLRASPTTVPAGQITFVASNRGWRTHELVVLPLAAPASAGRRVPGPDGKVTETGSLGEASGSCAAGSGKGITAGKIGWVTMTLPAGHYELVCNLENHYADGMHQELIVSG